MFDYKWLKGMTKPQRTTHQFNNKKSRVKNRAMTNTSKSKKPKQIRKVKHGIENFIIVQVTCAYLS